MLFDSMEAPTVFSKTKLVLKILDEDAATQHKHKTITEVTLIKGTK